MFLCFRCYHATRITFVIKKLRITPVCITQGHLSKYPCEDSELRNPRSGIRQQERTHIMENVLYNELLIRDCFADIGIVYSNVSNGRGNFAPAARENDFLAASGSKKTCIQSAYALETGEKVITENRPFALTGESFPKLIVRHDIRKRWYVLLLAHSRFRDVLRSSAMRC